MKWLVLVLLSVLVYAIIVASELSPRSSPAGAAVNQPSLLGESSIVPVEMREALVPKAGRVSVEGLPYRCVGMQLQRVDWMDKYKQSIDEIASVGADTVKF